MHINFQTDYQTFQLNSLNCWEKMFEVQKSIKLYFVFTLKNDYRWKEGHRIRKGKRSTRSLQASN